MREENCSSRFIPDISSLSRFSLFISCRCCIIPYHCFARFVCLSGSISETTAMWFGPLSALASLAFLSSAVLAQDPPGPGEPAEVYDDGAFKEPRGTTSAYRLGATMNVSWETSYETSNLWLIVGWSWGTPIQLAANIGQTWYEWKVSTDSTNSSEIYAFRVVNAMGTDEEQTGGGFLSAAFWIDGLPTSSVSSISHMSTSASAPAMTSSSATTSSTASQTPESAAVNETSGLSDSGKIGIGVGVGVGGIGLIALVLGIIYFKRSRNERMKAADSMEPYSQTPQTYASTMQPYTPSPAAELSSYYKPPGPSEMEGAGLGAELDGGEKAGLAAGNYPANAPGQHVAELQG
ncbi:uncharacterized protein F4812DRAFT_412826 [Daldinia caldariorum]|uniref:uncharacterized protein n=1 Tax=Daldinia caldariorum TaxID=326644 RepID=UPI002008D608|nr:uncharacterized protein F4812DRAFT_412826 [Daldinia caldariorum]KAI1471117.1 hypothetical protein F4812DRAFT_412826 [Daldinia caldariorum]